ncbi:MAG: sialate O-acetylesterase [Ruminococcus sp.]|nr:sialate O-acetylesterase [Ruminococcus sp.]
MKTAPIFSDNMVLQRHSNIRIFGTCSGSERRITVSIPELHASAEAVISGNRWEAILPALPECDDCSLVITCGAIQKVFSNVAVGEVWLAGGQSNMEYEIRNDKNGAAELKNCSRENVRYYYTPKCSMLGDEHSAAEAASRWETASETNSVAWSAVGWYFAKELSRKLGCIVGIIGCNWGGTSASAWVPREVLENNAKLRPYIDDYDKAITGKTDEQMISDYDEYTAYQDEWHKRANAIWAEDPDIPWADLQAKAGENRYPGPMGIKNPMRPCGLYETMVSRVCPYTIKGVLWYQGESDDNRPGTYYDLMSDLIHCWRDKWHNDEMAFLIVQLPMFRYREDPDFKHWAYIREAQMKLFRTIKNTGLAVALDCGEFNNIHPVDKSVVGHRLYLQAMSEVYMLMDRSETTAPMFESFEVRHGDTMIVYLQNPSGGLSGGDDHLEGFELAGADGVYYPADSVEIIGGSQINIRCSQVKHPVNVRFKWTNYASVGLFSAGTHGIPVAPFRTDDFPKDTSTLINQL